MKKLILTILTVSVLFPSCISKKDYAALEATNKQNKDLLNTATIKLNACIEDKTNSEASLKTLKDQVAFLKANIPNLLEVSIGQALVRDCLYFGLENTINMYKRLLE